MHWLQHCENNTRGHHQWHIPCSREPKRNKGKHLGEKKSHPKTLETPVKLLTHLPEWATRKMEHKIKGSRKSASNKIPNPWYLTHLHVIERLISSSYPLEEKALNITCDTTSHLSKMHNVKQEAVGPNPKTKRWVTGTSDLSHLPQTSRREEEEEEERLMNLGWRGEKTATRTSFVGLPFLIDLKLVVNLLAVQGLDLVGLLQTTLTMAAQVLAYEMYVIPAFLQ